MRIRHHLLNASHIGIFVCERTGLRTTNLKYYYRTKHTYIASVMPDEHVQRSPLPVRIALCTLCSSSPTFLLQSIVARTSIASAHFESAARQT